MHEDLLINAGLSKREVAVYTTLCVEGELMASEISKKTGLIRTNVYDILSSLIKKGIVSYSIKSGKKFFMAARPEKLLDYIDSRSNDLLEIKKKINEVLPELSPASFKSKRPFIEVYEGKEGFKTILEMSIRESIRTGKEIIGISVQQQRCRALGGIYHERWYKERSKQKIYSRYLMSAEEKIITVEYTKFKTLPKEAKNPNEIFIFGNFTTQFFFTGDLFTAIVIEHEEITKKYRDYFDFLWGIIK